MYKKGEQSWIRWIKKRIKKNLNFLAIAEGPTGIGKSWAMIRIAYNIDNDFESRQICFSFKDVMGILNSDWFSKKKYKVIVFDEAQTDISNRAWQSLTNKLFNYLLSTFRHRNVILLFTSPYSDFLDSQSMKLIHCKLEVKGHNEKTGKTHIRPKLLQYNSRMKKYYEHSLFSIRNNKYHKIQDWFIQKPPKHLIKPYEEDKIKFTDRLNKNIFEDLEKLDKEKLPSRLVDTDAEEDIIKIWDKFEGNTKKIAEFTGTSIPNVYKTYRKAKIKQLFRNQILPKQETQHITT